MRPADYPVQPSHLWDHFYEISQIPRPSGQEAAVRSYITGVAERHDCPWRTDAEGNLLVSVAASAGLVDREPVLIQNHLDMVTVKSSGSTHDFERDPLELHVEDGWLRARQTTLGADNGIGCAAALALLSDSQVRRPPLQLLFTVDEETGLNGALNLDPDLLGAQRMLNLDTEDWQELFVGCAGGAGWVFERSFAAGSAPDGADYWTLELRGLAGGHSGIQIHEQLGNAIKLLAQCLDDVGELQLCAADVGVAHNVIPREGWIQFACPAAQARALQDKLEALTQQLLSWLPAADHALALELRPADPAPVVSVSASREILDLLAVFPHGALAYNAASPGDLVDLSINLAQLRLAGGELMLEASYRFFNEQQGIPLRQGVLALARRFALGVVEQVGYPGWQPDFDSPLLARASDLHRELFGVAPQVKAIHAGLECGILKSKKPELDILSFGPTIRGAHSPAERLQIDTVEPFWRFLTALLAIL